MTWQTARHVAEDQPILSEVRCPNLMSRFGFLGSIVHITFARGCFFRHSLKKVLKIIFEVGEEYVQPVRCPSKEREILDNGLEL